MTYKEIMEQIRSGLTGDTEADIKYLQNKISEYEDHEDRDLIAGACGQLIYDLLPESVKEEFSELNAALRLGIDEYSSEAAKMLREGKTDEACRKLEDGIALLEGSDVYDEKDGVPYYDFRRPMEEAIFKDRYGFEKQIKLIPEPVVGLYRMYAGILYERKEHEKALKFLEKAYKWNPYHQCTTIEYADNLRELGRLEEFKGKLYDTFDFAYEPETLAKCYRRLAWYFSEKEDWEPAAACIYLAERYEGYKKDLMKDKRPSPEISNTDTVDEILQIEKKYILERAGDLFGNMSSDDIEGIARKYGMPSGPDMEIVNLAANVAEEFAEAGNAAAAKYFYDILHGLKGCVETEKNR